MDLLPRNQVDHGSDPLPQPARPLKRRQEVPLGVDQTALIVPLRDILPGTNARSDWDKMDERLVLLAESIQEQGILEPLLVRELSRPTSHVRRVFQLVAGYRRYTAAKFLGLTRVPVRVLAAHDDETAAVNLAENLAREDLSDADAIRALEQLHSAYQWGVRRIARVTGRPPSWVSERLAVAQAAQERTAVEAGQIAMATAVRIVRLRTADLEVHQQLVNRLEQGEHIDLAEVPRKYAVHESTQGLLAPPAESEATDSVTSEQGEEVKQSSHVAPASSRRVLTVGKMEVSLVRNLHFSLLQVFATLNCLREEQGRDCLLPQQIRTEFTAMGEEIQQFLRTAQNGAIHGHEERDAQS